MPDVSADQVGTATTWFTSEAGITATVLAFVSLALAGGLIWAVKSCRDALRDANAVWALQIEHLQKTWGVRLDQFRTDVKEAFVQNDDIADKVVTALHSVQNEIARMSGRRDRD